MLETMPCFCRWVWNYMVRSNRNWTVKIKQSYSMKACKLTGVVLTRCRKVGTSECYCSCLNSACEFPRALFAHHMGKPFLSEVTLDWIQSMSCSPQCQRSFMVEKILKGDSYFDMDGSYIVSSLCDKEVKLTYPISFPFLPPPLCLSFSLSFSFWYGVTF